MVCWMVCRRLQVVPVTLVLQYEYQVFLQHLQKQVEMVNIAMKDLPNTREDKRQTTLPD